MNPNVTIEPAHAPSHSRISISGLLFIGFGVGMIAWEVSTRLMQKRLGTPGHLITLGAAGYLVMWGVKECLTTFWPRLGQKSLGRYKFRLPAEGRVFLAMVSVLFIGSLLGRSNSLLLVFCCLIGPL